MLRPRFYYMMWTDVNNRFLHYRALEQAITYLDSPGAAAHHGWVELRLTAREMEDSQTDMSACQWSAIASGRCNFILRCDILSGTPPSQHLIQIYSSWACSFKAIAHRNHAFIPQLLWKPYLSLAPSVWCFSPGTKASFINSGNTLRNTDRISRIAMSQL